MLAHVLALQGVQNSGDEKWALRQQVMDQTEEIERLSHDMASACHAKQHNIQLQQTIANLQGQLEEKEQQLRRLKLALVEALRCGAYEHGRMQYAQAVVAFQQVTIAHQQATIAAQQAAANDQESSS